MPIPELQFFSTWSILEWGTATGIVAVLGTFIASVMRTLVKRRKRLLPLLVTLRAKADFWAHPDRIVARHLAPMVQGVEPGSDWNALRAKNPGVIRALPRRLRNLCVDAEALEMNLRMELSQYEAGIESQIVELLNQMEPKRAVLSLTDYEIVLWWLRPTGTPIRRANLGPIALWLDGQTPQQWLNGQLASIPKWHNSELVLTIHGLPPGKLMAVPEFVGAVHKRLSLLPGADEMLKHYRELRNAGSEILLRVDRRIPPIVDAD